MSERVNALVQASGLSEPLIGSLERNDVLFVLTGGTLLYQDTSGTRRVTLRDLTRIHSDQDGLLRVETPAGTALTASLLGFDPVDVQTFFGQVRDTTARVKQAALAAPLTPLQPAPLATPLQTGPSSAAAAQATARPAAPSPAALSSMPVRPSAPVGAPDMSQGFQESVTIIRPAASASGLSSHQPVTPPAPPAPAVTPTYSVPRAAPATAQASPAQGVSTPPPAAVPPRPQHQSSSTVQETDQGATPPLAVTEQSVPQTAEPRVTAPAASQNSDKRSEKKPREQKEKTAAPQVQPAAATAQEDQPPLVTPVLIPPAAAPLGTLAAYAQGTRAWTGRLRFLSILLFVAALGLAFVQFSNDQKLQALWLLIAGGIGSVVLMALADLVRLLTTFVAASSIQSGPTNND